MKEPQMRSFVFTICFCILRNKSLTMAQPPSTPQEQGPDTSPVEDCQVVEIGRACIGTDRSHLAGVYRRADAADGFSCQHPDGSGATYMQRGINDNIILFYRPDRDQWVVTIESWYCDHTDFEMAAFRPGSETAVCWNQTADGQQEQVTLPLEIACRERDFPEPTRSACESVEPTDAVVFKASCVDSTTARLQWTRCEDSEVTGSETLDVSCGADVIGSYCHECFDGYVCSDSADSSQACQLLEADTDCPPSLASFSSFGVNSPCSADRAGFSVVSRACDRGSFVKSEMERATCDDYYPGFPVCQDECRGYDLCAASPVANCLGAETPTDQVPGPTGTISVDDCQVVEVDRACDGTDRSHLAGAYRQVSFSCEHPKGSGATFVQKGLDDNIVLFYRPDRDQWVVTTESWYCDHTDFEMAAFRPGSDTAVCWNQTANGQQEQVTLPLEIACRERDFPEPSKSACESIAPTDAVVFKASCVDSTTARLQWTRCEDSEVTGSDTWDVSCGTDQVGAYCHECFDGYVCSDSADSRQACQLLEADNECPNSLASLSSFGVNSPCSSDRTGFSVVTRVCDRGNFEKNEVERATCDGWYPGFPVCQDECGGYDLCAATPVANCEEIELPQELPTTSSPIDDTDSTPAQDTSSSDGVFMPDLSDINNGPGAAATSAAFLLHHELLSAQWCILFSVAFLFVCW